MIDPLTGLPTFTQQRTEVISRNGGVMGAPKAYVDNRLYEKSDRKYYPGLRGWNAAIASRSTALARAVFIGDSITQLFCNNIAQKLNSQYNTRADSKYKALSTYDTWNTWTGTKEATHGLGGFGGTLSGSNEGTMIATCDGFVVLYDVQQSGGADLNIYIDGVLQTTINTTDAGISGATESGRVWTSSAFTYGSHTLRVTRSGTGTVMVSGAFYTNGNRTTGVQVYNAGHSGWSVSNFESVESTYEAVVNLAPALISVFLGTNDYASGAATFETNLTSMVQRLKSDNPLASILLIAPYQAHDRSGWSDFVQVVKDVAVAEETEFLDLYESMGGLGATADVYSLSDDNIHPNTKGADLMTSTIVDALIVPAIHNSSPYLKADSSIYGGVIADYGTNGSIGFGALFGYPIFSATKAGGDVGAEFWLLNGTLSTAIFSFPGFAIGWGGTTSNPDVNIARNAAGELTIYGSTGATYGELTTSRIRRNAGTPESAVTAPVGAICKDTTNGVLYVKNSGTGNTGWLKIPSISGTDTLTNKRVTPRVTSITSSATPTINTDNCDAVTITALATAITSMTTNLSGTPTNFQELMIRIKDDGTARAITWGASFEAKGVALPTTTVLSKVLTVAFIYDTVTAKWGCVGAAQEA